MEPTDTDELGPSSIHVTSDVGRVREFLAGPGVRYICSPERGPEPSLLDEALACDMVAVAQDTRGRVRAAAWLEKSEESPEMAVGLLALGQPLPRFPRAARMLGQLAEEARARGIRQITACVTNDVTDPVAEFRDAGLHVVSKLTLGGSMKVVLEPEPEPGRP